MEFVAPLDQNNGEVVVSSARGKMENQDCLILLTSANNLMFINYTTM